MKRELNEEALEQYLSFSILFWKRRFQRDLPAGAGGLPEIPGRKTRSETAPVLCPGACSGAGGRKKSQRKSNGKKQSIKSCGTVYGRICRADVEVGAFLSGGVDSAYVAALLSRENQEGGMEEEKEADKAYGKRAYTVGLRRMDADIMRFPRQTGSPRSAGLRHKSRLIREREFWETVSGSSVLSG